MKITSRTTLLDMGCIVCSKLNKVGISAFLSGGVVIAVFLALPIMTSGEARANAPESHLEKLKVKYPFALLGDDHGVLSENDLAVSSCEAEPTPFSPESISYPYWQCFLTKGASFECDNSGYDDDEKAMMAILAITARGDGFGHEYLSRRAISLDSCIDFKKSWKQLTAKQEYVCLAGPLISIRRGNSGRIEGHWIFDRFKTPRGCDSYFAGGCSLRYQIKNGCDASRTGP